MFKTILAAVDGSENGAEALDTAIELQKKLGSELLILSVYRLHDMWKASVSMINPELTGSTDDALEQFARAVAESSKQKALDKGVDKVRSFFIGGAPARTIVKFADDHDAGVIVLGSRGWSEGEKYMLGSVSHKVTSLSKRPVLVV